MNTCSARVKFGSSNRPVARSLSALFFGIVGLAAAQAANPGTSPAGGAALGGLTPPEVKQVTVRDLFWRPKLEIYRQRTIPHSWNYMGWELRALQKANGKTVEGDLNGTWGEANLHKFLETIAHSLALHPDPELEERFDEVVALLAGAQQPDGYLHAFVTNSGKKPWDPGFLDGSHDGYVLGHMIEAALAYYSATGKRQFLEIACRAADQAHQHFLGPPENPGFCGHAGLEMALVELYRVAPKPEYLALSRAFIDWRGRQKVKPFSDTPRAYFQDQVPVCEQKTLDGHAVRAIFFATGVADLALATGDRDYLLASERFWDSTARRRMTITGSTGPRKEHEAFGEDYELPNNGYYESCAACGLANFAQRMFLIERQSEPMDVLERVLYNAILHGISLDGTNSYYQNPLSDRDNQRYNSWVCCPPNLSRTLFQIGRYAYAYGPADVYVNLYVAGTASLPLAGEKAQLRVETDYPWNGSVKLSMALAKPAKFRLHLRIPDWVEPGTARVALNGSTATLPKERGYLTLDREWKAEDQVRLELPMPARIMEAHPNIRDCTGKVALQRGPLVYAFEGVDNPGLGPDVTLAGNEAMKIEHRPDLLGGLTVISGITADGKTWTAVPFYALANRQKSWQEVWVRQQNYKPSDRWWLGNLYRAAN